MTARHASRNAAVPGTNASRTLVKQSSGTTLRPLGGSVFVKPQAEQRQVPNQCFSISVTSEVLGKNGSQFTSVKDAPSTQRPIQERCRHPRFPLVPEPLPDGHRKSHLRSIEEAA